MYFWKYEVCQEMEDKSWTVVWGYSIGSTEEDARKNIYEEYGEDITINNVFKYPTIPYATDRIYPKDSAKE